MYRTRRFLSAIAAVTLLVHPLLLQEQASPKPAFDVVSIKLHDLGTPSSGGGPRGDRLTMSGVTLKTILQSGYQQSARGMAADFQVTGAPNWIGDDRYDVDAKADCSGGPISRDRFQLMVQSLVEDRFRLKAHLAPQEVPFYDLVVAKDGPKLKLSPDQTSLTTPNTPVLCAPPPTQIPPPGTPRIPFDPTKVRGLISMQYAPGSATATGNAVPVSTLLIIIRMEGGRPVADKTNLEGLYDFKLQFSPERMATPYTSGTRGTTTEPAIAAEPAASLFTALQEQLGLKLESSKGEIQVLVVESAQKPTPN